MVINFVLCYFFIPDSNFRKLNFQLAKETDWQDKWLSGNFQLFLFIYQL